MNGIMDVDGTLADPKGLLIDVMGVVVMGCR